jgi:hypothetical protein
LEGLIDRGILERPGEAFDCSTARSIQPHKFREFRPPFVNSVKTTLRSAIDVRLELPD